MQKEKHRLLNLLGDGKFGARGHSLEEILCFPGTRVAILERVDNWIKDPALDSRVLWIRGMAGRGKSTIASTVVHNWKTRASCAIFHFRRGQTALNARVVCALARQLGSTLIPQVKGALLDALRENQDIADKQLEEQFETLLVASLSKLGDHTHPILIVLDALDESDEGKEAIALINFIDRHLPSLPPNVKFLLTCRPEGSLPRTLESRGWRQENLDMDADVTNDIDTFFQEKFSEMRHAHRLSESWPQSGQLARLVDMSQGLFQWARTALNYIHDGSPTDRLRMLLKHPERWSGLDELYHQILQKAFHNAKLDAERTELLRAMLATLVLAPVPVHLEVLAGLHGDQELFEGVEMTDVIQFLRRDLLADLASLILIPASIDEPLLLMHASIADLLTDRTRCKHRSYLIDYEQKHCQLASLCLGVMVKSLKRNICGLSQTWQSTSEMTVSADQKVHRTLRYSCLAWSTHLTQGNRHPQADDTLWTSILANFEILSKDKLLFWLEVMVLVRGVPDALRMAREVHQWLLVSLYSHFKDSWADISLTPCSEGLEASDDLKKHTLLWHDTQRFVSMFTEPIAYGPQHIYASALPSCPTGTELGKYYARHATVKTIQGAKETWSSILWTRSVGESVLGTRFSADGQSIAVLTREGRLHFREPSAGDMIGTPCNVPASRSDLMVLSSDLRALASRSDNNTIRLWDAHTGNSIGQPLEGHSDWITSISLPPGSDGTVIAFGSYDKRIRLWDARTGNSIGQPLEGHSGLINSMSFSPDGTVLASGSDDNTIRLWDPRTGHSIGQAIEGHAGLINAISFSPDGTVLASGSGDNTIRLWDAGTGNRIGLPLEGHSNCIASISFSPDGTVLASGSYDKTIRLWDPRTGNSIGLPLEGHSGLINSMSFSPDGTVLASGSDDNTIRLWDACPRKNIGQPLQSHSGLVNSMSFSPDGTVIASGFDDNTIRIWDAHTGNRIGQPLEGHSGWINSISFSPDSTVLASASEDGTIRLWDARTGHSIDQPIEDHSNRIQSLSFSPNGTVLASGSYDGKIRLWDARTRNGIGQPLEGHSNRIQSVSFSPNGTVLASGSYDGTIRLWDALTGSSIGLPLEGHSGWITCVSFSPDGTVVASGSDDSTIRLWDARTGHSIGHALEGHSGWINSISFSPNGTVLASGSIDRMIRLWDGRTGEVIGQPIENESGWVISTLFLHEDTPFIALHANGCVLALRESEPASEARPTKSPAPSLPFNLPDVWRLRARPTCAS
ncbi:hypothetical protein FRB90_006833 [Tulasnella sp. 427]|nr:hypothetical protein FRB90_006833 [Tulasnella sp. 427]